MSPRTLGLLLILVALVAVTGDLARRIVDAGEASAEDAPFMKILAPQDGITSHPLLIAAPHDGYDLYTGTIARAIGRRLGAPGVLARNYRDPKNGRFLDVNRPTERSVGPDGSRGPERITAAGRAVFEEWVAEVAAAWRVADPDRELPVADYVEIHGHHRVETVDGRQHVIDVIEVATVGFSEEELETLHQRWENLRGKHAELAAMRFDLLHPRYRHDGVEVTFHYRATSARTLGILQDGYVRRALHIELPRSARHQRAARRTVAAALAELVAELPGRRPPDR